MVEVVVPMDLVITSQSVEVVVQVMVDTILIIMDYLQLQTQVVEVVVLLEIIMELVELVDLELLY